MSEDTFQISKVKCKGDTIRPVILNFENGVLKEGQERKVACRLYKRKQTTLLAAATKSMIYTGEVIRNDIHNTLIGIIDKKTNKVTLVALDQARMTPWFNERKCLDVSVPDKATSVGELNKIFGSKRVKRQTEQLQRMKLDINNVKDQLEQTVADIDVDVRDMVPPVQTSDNDDDYKPKINRNANTIEEVYVLNELVTTAVLDSLTEEVQRIYESGDDAWGTTEFVKQQLKKYQNVDSSDANTKCLLLLYVDCLIKFMLVPAKSIGNKKYVACSYSVVAHNDILKKFTIVSGNTRSRPNIMRDKCICYILVLSIIACGRILNLETISKELKLGLKKLQDVCRVLTFTVAKELVYLKLPLPAPITPHARNKKKK